MSNEENKDAGQNEKMGLYLHNYKVRFWDTQQTGFSFPEQTDSELKYDHLAKTKDRGVCFSGGGTVSVALIAGYLDALAKLGLTEDIGYISGVSGGTWGSAPYMYYPESNGSDQKLFGNHKEPADLTLADIDNAPNGSLAGMCADAKIADLSIAWLDHDLTQRKFPLLYNCYEEAVGQIFLQPAEIKSPNEKFLKWETAETKGDKKYKKPVMETLQPSRSFFTTTEAAAESIAKRNFLMSKDSFITLNNPNRPYYIMNTTMLVPKEKGDKHPTVYPFEFTPLYAGMFPNHGQDPVTNSQQLGGSYVESYGFNSVAKDAADGGTIKTGNNYRLDLCQPVGTSGAAVAELFQGMKGKLKDTFPNFKYWNAVGANGKPTTERYFYGDGGIIENTGIISLLLRNVTNIVSFVSQMTYYFKNGDTNAEIDFTVSGWEQLMFGYNEIACLFGGQLIDGKAAKEYKKQNKDATSVKVTWVDDTFNGGKAGARKVFADDANHTELDALIAAFENAEKSGGPVSANIQPKVIANPLFGITDAIAKDYMPYVKFTMLGNCSKWTNALPGGISERIGKGTLKDFPNVKTFGQNEGYLIQLTPDQANMLGNLAYWAVLEEQNDYKNLLTGKGFPHE